MKIKTTKADIHYASVFIKDIPCGHFFLYNDDQYKDHVCMRKNDCLISDSHAECFMFSFSKEAHVEFLDKDCLVVPCEIIEIQYYLKRD